MPEEVPIPMAGGNVQKSPSSKAAANLPPSRTASYAPGIQPSEAWSEGRHVWVCTGWAGEAASFLNIPSYF